MMIALASFFYLNGQTQNNLNLSFENINSDKGVPAGWFTRAPEYLIEIDSLHKIEGKYALSIASDPQVDSLTFAVCSRQIPAEYTGKTITLKGYIKTEKVAENGRSSAGLWLRLDGEDGVVAFDNMNDRPITGTTDWAQYSIELPLETEAGKIVFGLLLVGKGKMWADDLELLIDGKPLSEAKPKVIELLPAQLDSAFMHGSEINISSANQRQIKDLTLLGQIWGFLKYYHPAIAAGKHNWDFELFRILPNILKAENQKERDESLLTWIRKLGEIPECNSCNRETPEDAKLKPDLVWMNGNTLSSTLKEKLTHIYKNRNQERHYYISLAPGIGNPQFKNENSYAHFAYPDAGFRLLALYRYWNIIHYFFPYKHLIEENWNDILAEFIPRFIATNDELSYRLTALELIGRIHDTHANLGGRDNWLEAWRGKYYAPLQVKFIEEKAVVTDYYHSDWGPASGLTPGDQITTIDGEAVEQIIEERQRYYPASNRPAQLRNIARNLLRGAEMECEIVYRRDGQEKQIRLKRYDPGELNIGIDWAYRQPDSCYQMLSEDIGYIYLGNIKSSLLPAIFEKFKDTKGIVIDIRNYPSEFVVFSLGRYLLPKPTDFVKFTIGNIQKPGLFEWTSSIQVGEINPDYYSGKVVILINEISQSQAEYTTMALRMAPKATVIGSTTAAADGNVSRFFLPGNLQTRISGIGVYYPDGRETQRIGIIPDIEVKPTIEGIKAGRDELLEKAAEIIRKKD